MKRAILVLSLTLLAGCESQPKVDPNAPKTPEWEACIAKVESYSSCKINEAGQLDDGIKARVTRQTETMKNKANSAADRCEAALAKLPADDPCVPK